MCMKSFATNVFSLRFPAACADAGQMSQGMLGQQSHVHFLSFIHSLPSSPPRIAWTSPCYREPDTKGGGKLRIFRADFPPLLLSVDKICHAIFAVCHAMENTQHVKRVTI